MTGFNLGTIASLLLSVLSLFVALSAGLPALAKLYINRAYNPPEIDINIQTHSDEEPIPWYEFDNEEVISRIEEDEIITPIIFVGSGAETKDLNMERIEISISENWDLIEPFQQRAERIGFNQYRIPQGMLAHHGRIASGGGNGIPFPFEPQPEDCEFEVTVYSTVSASQFSAPILGSFPRYFGNVSLEPVSERCEISGET